MTAQSTDHTLSAQKDSSRPNQIKQLPGIQRRRVWAWALYDCANSAFAVTVITGFFPVFFKNYWSQEVPVTESTFYLGLTHAAAALCIALAAPFLGAIADLSGKKRFFVMSFTLLGCLSTLGLSFAPAGAMGMALLLMALGNIGFSGGETFNNAQLSDVAPHSLMHRVSALGFGLGYIGSGLLFTAQVVLLTQAESFGISKTLAVQIAFASVALWWLVFSLPLLRLVPDPEAGQTSGRLTMLAACKQALPQLTSTLKDLSQNRSLWMFLLAYWIYIDGVGTIIRMAVDYGMALGIESSELITAILITQFIAFPAALGFGYLGERIGAKRGILVGLCGYIALTVLGYFMQTAAHFYLLAGGVGLVQGGVQSLSRSLFAQMIPPDKSGEYFGLYNVMGKFAAILGPVVAGGLSYLTQNPRFSLLGVIPFFIIGGWLLLVTKIDPQQT